MKKSREEDRKIFKEDGGWDLQFKYSSQENLSNKLIFE